MTRTVEFTTADMRKFNTQARRVIALAKILEWNVRWLNNNGRVVALRNGNKEILVPTTNINSNRLRSWVDQIVRYSEPATILNIVAGKDDLLQDPDKAEVVALLGTDILKTLGDVAAEETQRRSQPVSEPEPAPEPEPVRLAIVEPDTVSGPTIVSTRPWMAHQGGTKGGGGKMYESPVVVVEVMSDGTEVYRCRFCRYYSNENPRSVSSHNSRAHRESAETRPEPVVLPVTNYEPTDFHREQSAARRLGSDLVMALDTIEGWAQMPAFELAHTLAERVIEARPERAPAEPLSDDQIIRRITALVDHGRLAEMHQEVQRMTDALREAEQAREFATTEAERLHGNLRALRELLEEEK